ncbi:MAG: fumarylacetoacetate hydrolase family protein [Vicinamibacterales bacterium]
MWHALATYVADDTPRPAIATDSGLYDLRDAARADAGPLVARREDDVAGLLRIWPAIWEELARLAARLPALAAVGRVRPLPASVALLAPYRPSRIFAAASNYRDHAKEMGTVLAPRTESVPYFFMKADSSITDPKAAVIIPRGSAKLDWEVELAAVIGRDGRDIAVDAALSHVAGYTVLNDVSARDLTRRSDVPFTFDWFRGKSHDTFGPLGPWIVPSSLIGDPQQLRLRLDVNGEVMQDDTTGSMIFSLAEQVAYLSTIVTLRAGDLIATGTPDGVGMGRGRFLKPGDVMRATIERIGTLENRIEGA